MNSFPELEFLFHRPDLFYEVLNNIFNSEITPKEEFVFFAPNKYRFLYDRLGNGFWTITSKVQLSQPSFLISN